MPVQGVSFSIANHAAWAPGMDTPQAWADWAKMLSPPPIRASGDSSPSLSAMPPMMRRRAGFLGKMALEVAYQCLGGRTGVPTVFCSRHGEVSRAVDLLTDLAHDAPLSPTSFGMAVHNATAGLFSIARGDQANHVALAAGDGTIEHAVIDACGLLADGAPMVLLVAYDTALPSVFSHFEDCAEQPHAWAWLMVAAGADPVHLAWSAVHQGDAHAFDERNARPGSLQVLRFQLRGDRAMTHVAGRRKWHWSRDENESGDAGSGDGGGCDAGGCDA